MKLSKLLPTLSLFMVVVMVLSLTSCKKETIAADKSISTISKAPAAKGGAETFKVNIKEETSIPLFIPCANGGAGEFVTLTGPLHILSTFTINGNNVSGTDHFQPQGISGIGETTGDVYHATGITEYSFKGSLVNGQFVETDVNNFRIIGPGPGNNYLVHSVFHLTFNANGTLTSIVDQFSSECK